MWQSALLTNYCSLPMVRSLSHTTYRNSLNLSVSLSQSEVHTARVAAFAAQIAYWSGGGGSVADEKNQVRHVSARGAQRDARG
jgi:hypothetical protein